MKELKPCTRQNSTNEVSLLPESKSNRHFHKISLMKDAVS